VYKPVTKISMQVVAKHGHKLFMHSAQLSCTVRCEAIICKMGAIFVCVATDSLYMALADWWPCRLGRC